MDFDTIPGILAAMVNTLLTTDVTPNTTLDAALGSAIRIPDADLAKFEPTQLIVWYDDSGEETLPIAEGWDGRNPIPLNFTGVEYDVLQKDHLENGESVTGARLGTHLYRVTPPANSFSMALNDPVVWCDIRGETGQFVAMPKMNEPTYQMVLEYRLTLTQARAVGALDALMNPQTWVERVRPKAYADMRAMKDALLSNDELTGPDGPTTLGYGHSGQVSPQIYAVQWGDVIGQVTPSGLQAASTALIPIRGLWNDYEV